MESVCLAGTRSRRRIEAAFSELWAAWGISGTDAWFDRYYQYANRVAHAYLLNELNRVPAFLVFLYVADDKGFRTTTRENWRRAVAEAHSALGIVNSLPHYVRSVFVTVGGEKPIPVD